MSASKATGPTAARFHHPAPILPVRDLAASIEHYVRILGFRLDWKDRDALASVSRDDCTLFLSQGDQGEPGTWAWIGVNDVRLLHEEYRESGAAIRTPPTNYPWALEMQVRDPDGNVLRFGSEANLDQPIGVWLDMRGILWRQLSDGTWTEVEDR